MLTINEHRYDDYPGRPTLGELAAVHRPGADIFILNGFPVPPDTTAAAGDNIVLIRKGETPADGEIDFLLAARHTPGVHKKIRTASIAVLGLGGLGSAVAAAMAKIGIGKMLLSDYDVVEPSNLNRQQYFIDQIGMRKTEALKDNLRRMHPSVTLELIDKKLRANDIPALFGSVDVIVECFDDPAMKAACMRCALSEVTHVSYIGSSGMAGFGDNNSIITRTIQPGVYIVGDELTEARPGEGLMAPRVGIAAHHQANQALRIILGAAPGRRKK